MFICFLLLPSPHLPLSRYWWASHPPSQFPPKYHCLWKIVFRTIITSTVFVTAWIHKHLAYIPLKWFFAFRTREKKTFLLSSRFRLCFGAKLAKCTCSRSYSFCFLYLNKFTLNTDIKFLMEWKSHYSLYRHHDMSRSLPFRIATRFSRCHLLLKIWFIVRESFEAASSADVNEGKRLRRGRSVSSPVRKVLAPKNFVGFKFPVSAFFFASSSSSCSTHVNGFWYLKQHSSRSLINVKSRSEKSLMRSGRKIRFSIHNIPLKWFPFTHRFFHLFFRSSLGCVFFTFSYPAFPSPLAIPTRVGNLHFSFSLFLIWMFLHLIRRRHQKSVKVPITKWCARLARFAFVLAVVSFASSCEIYYEEATNERGNNREGESKFVLLMLQVCGDNVLLGVGRGRRWTQKKRWKVCRLCDARDVSLTPPATDNERVEFTLDALLFCARRKQQAPEQQNRIHNSALKFALQWSREATIFFDKLPFAMLLVLDTWCGGVFKTSSSTCVVLPLLALSSTDDSRTKCMLTTDAMPQFVC